MTEIENILRLALGENRRRTFLMPKEATASDRNALHIAQLISAMANAEGGDIYAGVLLQRKKASGTYPFAAFPHQWIEQVAAEHISPPLAGLAVEELSHPSGSILRIRVPQSASYPHRCSDRHYYIKDTLGIRPLDEYDIRRLYLRSSQPEIDVWALLNTSGIPQYAQGKYTVVNFYPKLMVKNIGSAAESIYKVEMAVPTSLNNQNFDVLQKYFSRFEDGYTVYSYASQSPLFPNEIALIFEANLFVNADNFSQFDEGFIKMQLFFTQGYRLKDFRLRDLLHYRHEILQLPDFSSSNPELSL